MWSVGALVLDPFSEAQPEDHAVDGLLDDRVDAEGQQSNTAHRETAAAGLVTREARTIDDEDRGSGLCEAVGGRRARGPGADDGNVEVLHSLTLAHALGRFGCSDPRDVK